jgi:class 3 adenylate cyclase
MADRVEQVSTTELVDTNRRRACRSVDSILKRRSRLTVANEDWTIRALGEFRGVVDGIIARHDGRIFNIGGDSVLAEFASPVEAVRCAVDFQEAARSRNLLQSGGRGISGRNRPTSTLLRSSPRFPGCCTRKCCAIER